MPNVPMLPGANLAGAFGLITQDPLLADQSTLAPDLLTSLDADDLAALLRTAEPHVFNVADYGAVGDGVTNDTAHIQAAIDAAVAYAVSTESRYAEVVIPASPTPYLISGALVQGGTTKGNAQLTIPIVAGTARKVTLAIRGLTADGAAMPYWAQTTGQRYGVTLKSTLTTGSLDSNWGLPSVMGGPVTTGALAEYGSSAFNNLALIVENIGILNPLTPTLCGFDFRGMAQLDMRRCAVMVNAATSAISGTATNDWTAGVLFPDSTNNDRTVAEDITVYGHYIGIVPGEHMWLNRAACIYCHDGMKIVSHSSDGNHSLAMGAISIEGCVDALRCYDGAGRAPIHIAALSTETISGKHVNDPNNAIYGKVNITQITGSLAITGAGNVELISANTTRGTQTAPALPASTVALTNPFWRHSMVTVVGGTVTAITVDGVATGLTSGTVVVPSGKTIAVTYSVAPTWKWWTL
jgi:hypothetical protein